MKKQFIILLVGALLSLPLLADENLYVSPAGNDSWSGTLPEPNSAHNNGPLATLDKARLKVRERIAKGLSQPLTVLMRAGEYELEKTVVFGPEDSGTKSCPITYRAYPNETPVFTGAKRLTDWKPCTHDPEGLPAVAKGKLWVTEIPKGEWKVTTLYDGLTALPRSQSSEFQAASFELPEDSNREPKQSLNGQNGLTPDSLPVVYNREFHYLKNDLKSWSNLQDVEIFLSPKQRWLINMLPLQKIDEAKNTAYFGIDSTYRYSPGNPYKVENAIDYLDKAGEWVFNGKEGRIYLWPKQPLASSDIRAPFLQEFIRVEGIEDKMPVRFLSFAGLNFRHGLRDTWHEGDKGLQHDWEMYDKGNAVLRLRHAEDCAVDACTFTASSGSGVRLDLHCQRITVANSRFSYLGGTGIVLSGYGPGTKDENHHNVITNNYIHHVGEIYWHSPGIFTAQSGHNRISHNTIHDLGYNGIVISGCRPADMILCKPLVNRREWLTSIRMEEARPYIDKLIAKNIKNWRDFDINDIEPLLHARENRIENNEIYHVMLRLGDGNGIYLSAMGKNNQVEHNYLHDINNSVGCIRTDDNSSFTVINDNVCIQDDMLFVIKGPADVSNNFAINVASYLKDFKIQDISYSRNVYFENDPLAKSAANKLVVSKNKSAKAFYECLPHCSNSLFFSLKLPSGVVRGQDVIPAEKRGKAEVGMLFDDPLFDLEAMKQKIFRFNPGSPCEKLGIKPLDMSQVGSNLKDL